VRRAPGDAGAEDGERVRMRLQGGEGHDA
jgi:hypothetical protein